MSTKLCCQCERPLKPVFGDREQPSATCFCGWTGSFSEGLTEPMLLNPKPAMPYVSIDVETTGLNPETCQVLEFGAVYDDWTKPIDQLPIFRRYIFHERIEGEPYALALNSATLKRMSGVRQTGEYKSGESEPTLPAYSNDLFIHPARLGVQFAEWLFSMRAPQPVTAAGKNFASFDLQFLKRLPHWSVKFNHRIIDPAMLFWLPLEDKTLPGSETCYKRAGIGGDVAHTAVEDALAVVRLVRSGVKRLAFHRFSEVK